MLNKKVSFIIDQGNTRTKCAVFENKKMIHLESFEMFSQHEWNTMKSKFNPLRGIFSSVAQDVPSWLMESKIPIHHFTSKSKLPFKSSYSTMDSLGVDRIANVAAVVTNYAVPALIIDLGSCITYEFIDSNGVFIGGAISPGLNMRLRAMHEFTGKLPLIHFNNDTKNQGLIGTSTKDSMLSGAFEGIKGEIERYVHGLNSQERDLTIFLTGGDAPFFDLELKNDIFAIPNLTLMGLNEILKLNVKG